MNGQDLQERNEARTDTLARRKTAAEQRRRRQRQRLLLAGAGFLLFAAVTVGLVSRTSHADKGDERSEREEHDSAYTFQDLLDLFGGHRSAPKHVQVPDYVVQDLLPVNPYSRPGTVLEEVNGVVVHYVGNPGTTAEQNRSYFANLAQTHETSASSHFVIGIDGTIIQCVPLDEWAYCTGERNRDTISIECCHPDESGKFTAETMDSLVKLLRWLADTYDLDYEDIIRHYDVTGKVCPKYYVDHPDAWEALKDAVFATDG